MDWTRTPRAGGGRGRGSGVASRPAVRGGSDRVATSVGLRQWPLFSGSGLYSPAVAFIVLAVLTYMLSRGDTSEVSPVARLRSRWNSVAFWATWTREPLQTHTAPLGSNRVWPCVTWQRRRGSATLPRPTERAKCHGPGHSRRPTHGVSAAPRWQETRRPHQRCTACG